MHKNVPGVRLQVAQATHREFFERFLQWSGRKRSSGISIGFIFVFNSSPQKEVIPMVAKLGAIILIVVSMYVVADRSKYIWAIVLGAFFGAIGALAGYFVGALFYDYFL